MTYYITDNKILKDLVPGFKIRNSVEPSLDDQNIKFITWKAVVGLNKKSWTIRERGQFAELVIALLGYM